MGKMSNPDNRRGSNPNKSGQAFPSWNQPNPNDHLYWNSPQDEKSGRPPQNRVGIFGLSTPYVSPFPPHGYTNADFTGHANKFAVDTPLLNICYGGDSKNFEKQKFNDS